LASRCRSRIPELPNRSLSPACERLEPVELIPLVLLENIEVLLILPERILVCLLVVLRGKPL